MPSPITPAPMIATRGLLRIGVMEVVSLNAAPFAGMTQTVRAKPLVFQGAALSVQPQNSVFAATEAKRRFHQKSVRNNMETR